MDLRFGQHTHSQRRSSSKSNKQGQNQDAHPEETAVDRRLFKNRTNIVMALLLITTVINCTGPETDSFFLPLIAEIDTITGHTQKRVAVPSSGQFNFTSVDTNLASSHFSG